MCVLISFFSLLCTILLKIHVRVFQVFACLLVIRVSFRYSHVFQVYACLLCIRVYFRYQRVFQVFACILCTILLTSHVRVNLNSLLLERLSLTITHLGNGKIVIKVFCHLCTNLLISQVKLNYLPLLPPCLKVLYKFLLSLSLLCTSLNSLVKSHMRIILKSSTLFKNSLIKSHMHVSLRYSFHLLRCSERLSLTFFMEKIQKWRSTTLLKSYFRTSHFVIPTVFRKSLLYPSLHAFQVAIK